MNRKTFTQNIIDNVKKIANRTSELYKNRCQYADCEKKSYNQCQGTDYKQCIDYPVISGCVGTGASVSQSSGIRIPEELNLKQLTNDQRLFFCSSAMLDDVFKQIKIQLNTAINRQYIGTFFGLFRAYPGTQQANKDEVCINKSTKVLSEYDPRVRPWYIAATSGSKNIIIVIDTSSSMVLNKFNSTKMAAKSVLKTLGMKDYVNIIKFSENATILDGNDTLVLANSANLNRLYTQIDSLQINEKEGRNYQLAFQKIFILLNNSKQQNIGINCKNPTNVVIFFTGGPPNVGATSSDQLIQKITSFNSGVESSNKQFNGHYFTLFPYPISVQNDTRQLLGNLSCKYNGTIIESSSSDPITNLRNYFIFISSKVNISEPVWSEPFSDANTGQQIITASMPIFYQENEKNDSIRKILGAAAVSLPMKSILKYGESREFVLNILMQDPPCSNSYLSPCQLQQLRLNSFQCPISEDCQQNAPSVCQKNASFQILQTPPIKGASGYECCRLNNISLALICSFIGGFFLIVALVLTIIFIKKRRQSQSLLNKAAKSQQSSQAGNKLKPIQHIKNYASKHHEGQQPIQSSANLNKEQSLQIVDEENQNQNQDKQKQTA